MINRLLKNMFCCVLCLLVLASICSDAVFAQQTVGDEWYVIGMRQSGEEQDFSQYEAELLAYLEENTIYSATSRQKYALALLAAGSENQYIQNTVNDSIGKQGLMSWVFGLHLLHNGCVSEIYTIEEVKNTILSMQLEDGGWAITGTVSDADATAMVLQALAPYKKESLVKTAIEQALERLSQMQLEDGDFASYGVSNPESTAQVLIALSALGIDCKEDSRFIKNDKTLFDGMEKYQLAPESYSHQLGGAHNEMATSQVFCAKVAYNRMKKGQSGLYQFDTQTTVLSPVSKKDASIPLKVWICVGFILAGGIACLVLFLLKKETGKRLLAVLLTVILAVGIVLLTDIQTAEEYYNSQPTEKPDVIGTVTLSIRCDTVPEEKRVILDTTEFSIAKGDTVFTILTEAARKHGIHLEYSGTETMAYIKGMDHLYEMQHGDLSGWIYHVNGKSHSLGCSEYVLQDGDVIVWHYSCELGKDIP